MVESIDTSPWASLTFVGERHHLVILLRGAVTALAIAADDVMVPGVIVAIERADWAWPADGAVLTLDLLTIATLPLDESPTR